VGLAPLRDYSLPIDMPALPRSGAAIIGQMPKVERIQSTRWLNARRSQRVVLRLPIAVRAQFEEKDACAEKSHTLVVNAHGALIALTMRVHLEQPLSLQ